jgi:hypothetical protein
LPRKRPALKHGLTSDLVVLPGESVTVYDAFEELWLRELEPRGALESWLAHRVVAAAWRLARIERLEGSLSSSSIRELIERAAEPEEPDGDEQLVKRGRGWKLRNEERYARMATLGRHEAAIERVFYRALHELQDLQAVYRPRRAAPPVGFGVPAEPEPSGGADLDVHDA